MDPCVFTLMEISKQKPPITVYLPEPYIFPADEWLENLTKKIENLYLELKSFDSYGTSAMKDMKVHPDTFMQIAIQVAGYRTNSRSVGIAHR